MGKILFFCISTILGLGFQGNIFGQYQVQCKYLISPELNLGYVDSCATFWLKSYDDQLGGFYTNVDRVGNVISAWGTNKNMLTQSRNAYGMVRAFMLTGKEEYLERAKSALEFMYGSAWDETYGGWFSSIDKNGSPFNVGNDKTAFDQHYALLGILAYYEATGDTTAWNWFRKGYLNNMDEFWDSDPSQFGYYDKANFNLYTKTGKSFNATVDAVTTHLLNAYLLTEDDEYKNQLINIAENIVSRLTSTMDSYKIGFVEEFSTDWSWNDNTSNDNTRTIMGHVLKAGWVLGRIHQVLPDNEYIVAAEKLVSNVFDNGYDHLYGAPYKDYDRVTGEMYFYGQDTAKAWWQVEQAIVAGLELYDITNDDKYLEMADESLNFFMRYFVDHTYGDIYADVFRNGDIIPSWGTNKGNGYKAGYHSIETGYYSYLYGNVFFNDRAIELFYKIEPLDYGREIAIAPISTNKKMVIDQVELDGQQYTNYEIDNNNLIVDANIGGIFKIKLRASKITDIVMDESLSTDFELTQNYPNPFNPSTLIKFSVPNKNFVSLNVYNIQGEKVASLVNDELISGNYEITFNAENLASGVYIYILNTENVRISKKMMLLK